MRAIVKMALTLIGATFASVVRAQGAAVAAAPVVPVTTTSVPAAAAPAVATVLPTPGIGQPSGAWDLQQQFTPIGMEARHMATAILDP